MYNNVDVVIPVYKPGKRFFNLIEQLEKQSLPVNKMIIMNTEQVYFDTLILGTNFYERHPKVEVHHLTKKEFDHGKTRHEGIEKSNADVVVLMTDDAVPADENLIANLVASLDREKIAVAYARQLADKANGPLETYTRDFNYPKQSVDKSLEDIPTMGIKTFFCSNVCAAYDKKIYDELGGFIRHTIFNEDMIYAAKAVKAGYKIAYCANALVLHSHRFTGKQQFHRNFDLGVSQADHPEIFEGISSESEGIRMIKKTISYLRKNHKCRYIPTLIYQSGCKYIGYQLGKHYQKLSRKLILKCTMNQEYWK